MSNTSRWAIGVGALLVSAVVAAVVTHHPPSPIPAPVKAAVTTHFAASDTADRTIATAKQEAAAARARSDSAVKRAAVAIKQAKADSARADSLARVAASAQTARDSAIAFHAAYDARTAEASQLHAVIHQDSIALTNERARGDTLAHSLAVSDSLRHQADSLLHVVVRIAETGGCTIPGTFGHIGCPSRKTAFVAGAAITIGTAVIVKNAAVIGKTILPHARRAPSQITLLSWSTP